MELRTRGSPQQFAAILYFMESHGDIGKPQQGPQSRIKADRLWQELIDTLNSMSGGVIKSMEKWKKVWADWKTKTKKKALAMQREAHGPGGSSRQTRTALEQRVLGIMGLSDVIGQVGVEERQFNAICETVSLPLPNDSLLTEVRAEPVKDVVIMDFEEGVSASAALSSLAPSSGQISRYHSHSSSTPTPASTPALMQPAVACPESNKIVGQVTTGTVNAVNSENAETKAKIRPGKTKKHAQYTNNAVRKYIINSDTLFKKRQLEMLEIEHTYKVKIAKLKIKKLEQEIAVLENRKNTSTNC